MRNQLGSETSSEVANGFSVNKFQNLNHCDMKLQIFFFFLTKEIEELCLDGMCKCLHTLFTFTNVNM